MRRTFFVAACALVAACTSNDAPGGSGSAATASEKPGEAGQEEHAEGEENRVTLTEAAARTAEIEVEVVRSSSPSQVSEELEVPGQVEYDPRRVALVSPRVSGRLERLTAVEGDRVASGETVALLFSPDYVTAQHDVQQAARRAALLAGTADEQGTRSLLDAAQRRLRLLGVPDEEVRRIAAGGEPRDFLAVAAPFAGSIVEAHAMAGAALEAGEEIFKVADVSVVDVVAEVPERSMPLVSVGQRAVIAIAAYPSMRFEGRVERLRGELNQETRTVRAVIHANNPTGRLRPGMFASVRLSVSGPMAVARPGEEAVDGSVLTIPESAVVSDGSRRFVFVEVGTRTYERRQVTVSPLAPEGSTIRAVNRVVVRDAIAAGERVVVRGAFALKSELAKAGLGEHGH